MIRSSAARLFAASLGLGLALSLVLVAPRLAQADRAADSTRVATVQLQQLYDKLKEFNDRNAQFLKEQQRVADSIKKLGDEVDALRGQSELIKPDDWKAKLALDVDIARKTAQLNAERQLQLQRLDFERGEIIRTIYEKIIKAIEEVATENAYDIVLYDGGREALPAAPVEATRGFILERRVLFASKKIDITDQVLNRLNAAFVAGG